MSERDWSLPTAVGVIAVVCLGFAIGLWGGLGNSQHNGQSEQQTADPYQPDLAALSGSPVSYEAICEAPKDREYADLCQQWRSAQTAEFQKGLGVVGLIGLAATVFFAGWSVLETRKNGEAQVRAYVEVEKASIVFRRPNMFFEIYRPEVTIDVVNSGNSPALDYCWHPEVSYGHVHTSGAKFRGAIPSLSEGRDIPANKTPVRLTRRVPNDVAGASDVALQTEGLRVFVTIRSEFTDVFKKRIPRSVYLSGDVKAMGPHQFGCDLEPAPIDDNGAIHHGMALQEIARSREEFLQALSRAAAEAEAAAEDDDPEGGY